MRGILPALLLAPRSDETLPFKEPKGGMEFRAVCYVYVQENSLLFRRFTIYAPDRELLPFARRVGRFYALVWGVANRRLGTLAGKLRETVVHIWLTRSGEAGGEQFRNNLYIYDLFSERTGIEWARELTHEYGHYLLPGASGYNEPESWANGVLGERLFLKWLMEDLAAGRLDAAQVPYVRPTDLQDYCARQVTPLIEQVQQHGPDIPRLSGNDRKAMDAFTGLLLFADAVYGSRVLLDMLEYLPPNASAGARGSDFYQALRLWAEAASTFTTTLPTQGATRLYIPPGRFRVRGEEEKRPSLIVDTGVSMAPDGDGWVVTARSGGWRRVRLSGSAAPAILRWERL